VRIASMLPSATEMACALGLRADLVAVSHECDYPPGVGQLPHLTASILGHGLSDAEVDAAVSAAVREGRPLYAVDADLLDRVRPELILTQGICDVCAVTPDTIQTAMGLLPASAARQATVLSLDGRSVDEVLEDLLRLGRATDRLAEAEAEVARLRARWAALPGVADPGLADRGPRVMMLEWADPPFTGGHWVPEQVRAAGAFPVLGAPGQDSRRATWDEVEAADPDVLCVIACGYGLEANLDFARRLAADPRTGALRAVREGRLWALDANACFSRPTGRLVRGAELLVEIVARGRGVQGESARLGDS
jgi:iron complex transport system substrate-binding protein